MDSSPFRDPTFRRLFAAQAVALFGAGLATIALGLLAYELAGSRAGVVLGTALTIKMLTYVTVAPVAGAYADRLPRRATLVTLDLARLAAVLVLPLVTEVWQVYVLIAVLQAASAAFTPTFQAAVPDVLPDERTYTKALSASQLASSMETLLSPMLAAAALTVLSFHWLFAGTALGFAGSAMLVAFAAIPPAKTSARSGVVDRLAAGMQIFIRTPRLRGLLGLNLAVAAAGAVVMVNTVNYVRDVLHGDEVLVAVLLAANGTGTIAAALAVPRVVERCAERSVMLAGGTALCAGSFAAAGAASTANGPWSWPLALAVWALLGVGAGLVLTPVGRVLRRCAAESDRPAVFAAQFSLSHACWLLAYPLAGYAVTTAGFVVGWLVLGGLAALGLAAASALWPRSDVARLWHTHRDLPAGHRHLADAVPAPGGGWRHVHDFVVDRRHPRWPVESR